MKDVDKKSHGALTKVNITLSNIHIAYCCIIGIFGVFLE